MVWVERTESEDMPNEHSSEGECLGKGPYIPNPTLQQNMCASVAILAQNTYESNMVAKRW